MSHPSFILPVCVSQSLNFLPFQCWVELVYYCILSYFHPCSLIRAELIFRCVQSSHHPASLMLGQTGLLLCHILYSSCLINAGPSWTLTVSLPSDIQPHQLTPTVPTAPFIPTAALRCRAVAPFWTEQISTGSILVNSLQFITLK